MYPVLFIKNFHKHLFEYEPFELPVDKNQINLQAIPALIQNNPIKTTKWPLK